MSEEQPAESIKSLRNTNLEDTDIIDLDEAIIEISERHDRLIAKTGQDILNFCAVPRSQQEIQTFCKQSGKNYFSELYLKPLLENGQLHMTMPEKPNSRNQKYFAVKVVKKS